MVGLAVDLGFLGAIRSLDGERSLDAAALAHRAEPAGADLIVAPSDGGRLSRLAEMPEVEQVRVGASLLARSVYKGIGAAVRAARDEIERGARRGDRGEEQE